MRWVIVSVFSECWLRSRKIQRWHLIWWTDQTTRPKCVSLFARRPNNKKRL